MTPRHFHRSRLFWLGLPGLIFLAWVWLGTRTYYGWVTQGTPSMLVSLNTGAGVYALIWEQSLSPANSYQTTLTCGSSRDDDPTPLFGSAIDFYSAVIGGTYRLTTISVTHWFAVVVYLILWTTAMIYRQRHKRRLLDPPPAP